MADGEDQAQKGTQLLEIYALEIQMYNETKNFKKLKVGRCRALSSLLLHLTHGRKYTPLPTLSGQLSHTRVSWGSSKNAVARCGWGNVCCSLNRLAIRLTIAAGNWNRASEDFFESFRNYDEAGSPQRIQVLKYLVLANMLTGSEVNPFDSQETKPSVPRQ